MLPTSRHDQRPRFRAVNRATSRRFTSTHRATARALWKLPVRRRVVDRERLFAARQPRKPGRAERNERARSGHLRLPGKLAWRFFHWSALAMGCPCAAFLPPIPEVAPEWSQRTCRGLVQQQPARRVLSSVLWFRRSKFYLQSELFFRLTTTQLDVSKRYLRRLMNTKLLSIYSNCRAKPSCLSQSHSGAAIWPSPFDQRAGQATG